MNVSASGLLSAAKLAIVVPIVLAIAVFIAGRDANIALADSAEIVIGSSPSNATATPSAVLITGDAPRTFYIWARNINDPLGVGAYQIDAGFNGWIVNIDTMTIPSPNWLFTTTGRSGTCLENPPEITLSPSLQGRAWFGCHTVGPPPPAGPQTNGMIASFSVEPGPFEVHAQTIINISSNSFLKDTGDIVIVEEEEVVVDPAFIPTSIQGITFIVARCADIHPEPTGDTQVTLSDILTVATKFGQNDQQPGWQEIWDISDDDGSVTLTDILIAAQEFGRSCTI